MTPIRYPFAQALDQHEAAFADELGPHDDFAEPWRPEPSAEGSELAAFIRALLGWVALPALIWSLGALLAMATHAWGQEPKLDFRTLEGNVAPWSHTESCFHIAASHDVLRLCPAPPTIWMSPDMEPREVAERFLDALRAMGFKQQESR